MKYVECPEVGERIYRHNRLFLGGGITGCPDWQAYVVSKLHNTDLIVFNPRRSNKFAKGDHDALKEQITWEHKHMRLADAITFWFPPEAVASMTIFELGAWLCRDKKLFVGFDPAFKRKDSFTIQTHLERPDLEIVDSLDAMIDQIIFWEENT